MVDMSCLIAKQIKIEKTANRDLDALSVSLFHGTTLGGHLDIQKSKYIGVDYTFCKGIHLTDDFNKALIHGMYIYEFNLPFQNQLISMIPNTDTGERELWLDFYIPIHRVKKVWILDIDYDFTNHEY